MGIESGGCYAEQVATHARQALPVPPGLALADAAAVPEVFLTAWDALVVQGGLTSGRWALVHAGASGVGTAAIQIVKAIGARVAVTCSSGKAAACRELGADLVLERSPADWPAALRAGLAEHGRRDGVDVILDVIGGEEADRNLGVVRGQGHDRPGRPDGRRHGDGQRRAAAGQAGAVDRHGAALPGQRGEAGDQPALRRRGAAAVHAGAPRARSSTVASRWTRSPRPTGYMEADANVGKILLDVR